MRKGYSFVTAPGRRKRSCKPTERRSGGAECFPGRTYTICVGAVQTTPAEQEPPPAQADGTARPKGRQAPERRISTQGRTGGGRDENRAGDAGTHQGTWERAPPAPPREPHKPRAATLRPQSRGRRGGNRAGRAGQAEPGGTRGEHGRHQATGTTQIVQARARWPPGGPPPDRLAARGRRAPSEAKCATSGATTQAKRATRV